MFADDTTTVLPGTSRLVLRHTAAAEDVNVLLNAQAVSTGVAATTEAATVLVAVTVAFRSRSRRIAG